MNTLNKKNAFFPSVWNELFENIVLTPQTGIKNGLTSPAVNVKETDDNYTLEVAAPGLSKNDFNIKLDEDLLNISADVKAETEEKDSTETYTRKEFGFKSFNRNFTLPDSSDKEKITATYFDGILTVNIAKREEAKPKPARSIEIG